MCHSRLIPRWKVSPGTKLFTRHSLGPRVKWQQCHFKAGEAEADAAAAVEVEEAVVTTVAAIEEVEVVAVTRPELRQAATPGKVTPRHTPDTRHPDIRTTLQSRPA